MFAVASHSLNLRNIGTKGFGQNEFQASEKPTGFDSDRTEEEAGEAEQGIDSQRHRSKRCFALKFSNGCEAEAEAEA